MASLSVHHGTTWLVGGEFCEKMKFVVFEMWGLKRPANIPKWTPWNSWCTKVLNSEGFAHGKLVGAPWHNLIGWWGVLWKMKFVVFEMWGLERPKNVPKWRPLSSWCTKVLSLEGFAHGKLVGAPPHNLIGWWGVLWKNEIRGFWDVRVGKAYKCPQMKTLKFLVHESFEFGGVCTWPWLLVTTA